MGMREEDGPGMDAIQGSEGVSGGRGSRTAFVLLNVVGGVLVLGSYAFELITHPETRGEVWGDVPGALQPLYTVCMFLAAGGYFFFTSYVLLRLDPERVRVFGRYGFGIFHVLYAAILFPSAAWLTLTFRMIDTPTSGLWIAIRLVLLVVGVCSLALIAAIRSAEPRGPVLHRALALVGAVLFAFQTAVLDALVWAAYFPV